MKIKVDSHILAITPPDWEVANKTAIREGSAHITAFYPNSKDVLAVTNKDCMFGIAKTNIDGIDIMLTWNSEGKEY